MEPKTCLRAGKLDRSLHFYRQIGFEVHSCQEQQALISYGGHTLVLAELDQDWEGTNLFRPMPAKDLIYFHTSLTEAMKGKCKLAGASFYEMNYEWENALVVYDPEGYKLMFKEAKALSDKRILELYEQGIHSLHSAVEGVTVAQLDEKSDTEEWSIRQEVHHLIEEDLTSLMRIKMTLAEPGRVFHSNVLDFDVWQSALPYDRLPIEYSITMFEAIRKHVLQLVAMTDDPMNRYLVTNGRHVYLRDSLRRLAGHVLEHTHHIMERRGMQVAYTQSER
ncbi:DinB family protein [Brevibacillus sp. 179-C9.3 HS]|uniref:DinB family protein n=1 Tax=unclassified Brevibacillus TaxID=2684853 RepID=UPI0039A0CF0A